MINVQKQSLKDHRKALADDIVVTEELLGDFYAQGVFPKSMIDEIRTANEPNKVHILLELLPKRGPNAYKKFVEILRPNDRYPWLAELLTGAAKRNSTQFRYCPCSWSENENRRSDETSRQPVQTTYISPDIKKQVKAFVHKQFGSIRHISLEDLNIIRKYLAEEIQRERNSSYSCEFEGNQSRSRENDSVPDLRRGSLKNYLLVTEVSKKVHAIEKELAHMLENFKPTMQSDNNDDGEDGDNYNRLTRRRGSCTCDGGDVHENDCELNQTDHSATDQEDEPGHINFDLLLTKVREVRRHVAQLHQEIGESRNLLGDCQETLEPYLCTKLMKRDNKPISHIIRDLVQDFEEKSHEARHYLDESYTKSDTIDELQKEIKELNAQNSYYSTSWVQAKREKSDLQRENDRLGKMLESMKREVLNQVNNRRTSPSRYQGNPSRETSPRRQPPQNQRSIHRLRKDTNQSF